MRDKKLEEEILTYLEYKLTPYYLPPYVSGGHDVTHIQRMCAVADKIVGTDVNIFLLKVTIWLHNIDRSNHDNLGGGATKNEEFATKVILGFLSNVKGISEEEKNLILETVLKHNKLNDPSDNKLLVYLKDCDRLDVGAIGILRIAAYRNMLLPYNPEDFKSITISTQEEDIKNMLDDFQRMLEWEDMLRIPKARRLARSRFKFIKTFLLELNRELEELFKNQRQ